MSTIVATRLVEIRRMEASDHPKQKIIKTWISVSAKQARHNDM
jgi:hypothetical protein